MSRTTLRTAAVVTLAALFAGSATASFASVPDEEVIYPTPVDSTTGSYIVLLEDAPLAGYTGGVDGLAPTAPEDGKKLNSRSQAAQKYKAHLNKKQKDTAASAGVTPFATYDVTLNGFSATMSAAQAAKLQATKGVLAVYPDEIRHPDAAVPSTDFLGLSGEGGVWESVGGVDAAGEGIVVGVVDTGIAPENPSFAGSPLTASGNPRTDGSKIYFDKADGETFTTDVVTGEAWTADAYNSKLIGARYFSAGAAANGFDFGPDYLSPRDFAGHGSHTASTAAGNADVPTTVEGIDFGPITGVAPAAKVAAYKACYDGPDPLSTDDDICALSDLLDAIDTAVADGVDVINYSIGGGSAPSVLQADDLSFLHAAAAGVYVSVSAGNSGPGASTADHASPWYTTVAASTIPTYEGTVELGNGLSFVGASVTVPFGGQVPAAGAASVVYAGEVAAAGAATADAALCVLGTLDAAKVAGKIVLCDRGGNARVEKSQEVEAAGGIGVILVNPTPNSLDNDFHSVPTIHVGDTARQALLTYVQGNPGATATLVSGNQTGTVTPTPQVAGFSSRGPMLADGSDVIKPDVAAPGVAILAAVENAEGAPGQFSLMSGTSMAAPHVAGLGALYLGERPLASPAEIKSALMTTAYDTVNGDGSDNTDPFAQGAGHVDPTEYFAPGLLYLNDVDDWNAYLQGLELGDYGVPADDVIDASDLNLASIGVGSLAKPQTVTRTVTVAAAGTYTASVQGMAGVTVDVQPAQFTAAAGDLITFTVGLARTTAAVEEYTTGSLTWTSGDTVVRSPIAVRPVTADAPVDVMGAGLTGSTAVTITPGLTGQLPLNTRGLTEMTQLFDRKVKAGKNSGNENSGTVYFTVDVPEGTAASRFDLDALRTEAEGADLDLYVYRVVSKKDWSYYTLDQSATGAADEQVTLIDPVPGTYLIEVDVFTVPEDGKLPWDLRYANLGASSKTPLTATPNPLAVTQGVEAGYTLSWTNLKKQTRYFGAVQYGDSSVWTFVTVDSGAKK